MPHTGVRDVRRFPDLESLSIAAAEEIAALAQASVAARGRFTVALSGGNTPRRTYELLAERHRDAIDWGRVEVVFGDERMVPPGDGRSNYRMAHDALLARVPIAESSVHPVPTEEQSAEQAAEQYERVLRQLVGERSTDAGSSASTVDPATTVDLALLGLGPDGHTASLFPGAPALAERTRWVRAVDAPTAIQPAVPRVTTTFPFLDGARSVIFLVAGADKRRVVREILGGSESSQRYPAALVAPRGSVIWLIEESALAP